MRAVKAISPWQFAVFRIALGIYLVQHFAWLIGWAPELWSREGILGDAAVNVTHGILPNPLEWWDTPAFATGFVIAMLVLSVAFMVGVFRRTTAVLLWFGWACLFNRNNLISNPGIPYVGLVLLLTALVPPGEPLSVHRRRAAGDWKFPAMVFWCAWILLAVGYTFSGLDKLMTSPSWRDGSAMLHLLENPLARPGVLRDVALALPDWMLQVATWCAVALEVLFLPLCLTRVTRLFAWTAMLAMHLGILLVIDFADLTFGMVMIHLFTFDPAWFPPRPANAGRNVVFFDGVCVLCNRVAGFLHAEDTTGALRLGQLQGVTFASLREQVDIDPAIDSVVYVREIDGESSEVLTKSDAALGILRDIGGFWRVVSWLRVVPRHLRDRLYDVVAGRRYAWFGRYDACAAPDAALRARVVD